MGKQFVVHGSIKSDGTLELDEKPTLPAGRVRVTVEPMIEAVRPERFWAMMQSIWADLQASGRSPRTREAIDAEINALRDEAEEELQAVQCLHGPIRRGDEPGAPGQEQNR
jgi:hypothetical protein